MEPSLPLPSPSLSFWHRTTRAFKYLNANHQADVPSSIKYLIIGSGITGTLTAYELIKSGVKGEDILIVEAREAVSGATGRNAGHIRPDAFRGFPAYSAIHGPEQARKIIENERVVLENVRDFVEKNKIDAEFKYTTTFDVCLSQTFADHEAKSLAAYKAAGGDISHVKFHDGDEAKTKTRVPDAICAYEWPAASNHPAKLTHWVLNDIISKGARLWTHCPVTQIVKYQGSSQPDLRWMAHTSRGVVAAETVIHCTNAYAAFLLPELTKFIAPRRAQAHTYVPPLSVSGENVLKPTMSLRYNLHHFFSVNQLCGSGTFVFGGSSTRSDADSSAQLVAETVSFDDSRHCETFAENSRREFSDLFPYPDGMEARPGEGFDQVWTGILGMTADSVPLVGPVDGLEGQWICAGFNGHGMARIFTCAPGLVKLLSGMSWQATGLPECFQYSNDRIDKFAKRTLGSSL